MLKLLRSNEGRQLLVRVLGVGCGMSMLALRQGLEEVKYNWYYNQLPRFPLHGEKISTMVINPEKRELFIRQKGQEFILSYEQKKEKRSFIFFNTEGRVNLPQWYYNYSFVINFKKLYGKIHLKINTEWPTLGAISLDTFNKKNVRIKNRRIKEMHIREIKRLFLNLPIKVNLYEE